MALLNRGRRSPPNRQGRDPGQGLVEFALVLPIFMTLTLFIIEFAFVFSAILGVSYASRNAALTAAEAGNDRLADCLILQQVENSISSPANDVNIKTVTIYLTDGNGVNRLQSISYTRTGSMQCKNASVTMTVRSVWRSATSTPG